MGAKPRDDVATMYRQMRELAASSTEVGPAGPAVSEAQSALDRLEEIAPGVARIPLRTPTLPPATHTNCYLIGEAELIIIDPATPDRAEKDVLDQVIAALIEQGRRPAAVWLTHHHGDHIADAARLAALHRIPIAAHPETAARLGGIEVGELLHDGQVRHLGGSSARALRAVFTPGHAPGHLCFVEEKSMVCVAGDMVAGIGSILIDPSEGDMTEYLASLRLLAGLGLSSLLPAHGPILPDPKAALFAYVAHRLWREGKVLDALDAHDALDAGGATAEALLPAVYSDVPAVLFPLARRSLLSHLIKLERDQLAWSQGEVWKRARS